MNKLLLVFAALVACCSSALAVDHSVGTTNMANHCRCVMEGGICKVENGRPLPAGSRVFTALGPITAEQYNDLKSQGVLMCESGREACTASWDGDRCRVFRTWYVQEPTVCTPKK